MSESTLGTFRVDKGDWDKFKSLCSDAGSSASAEIVAFIRSCNEQGSVGDRLPGKSELEELKKNLDSRIDSRLNEVISPLIAKIEAIEQKIGNTSENSPSRLPSEAQKPQVRALQGKKRED